MRWLFEQYELGHTEVSSLDFAGDLSDTYDVIVLPSGTTRSRIVSGLDPQLAGPTLLPDRASKAVDQVGMGTVT